MNNFWINFIIVTLLILGFIFTYFFKFIFNKNRPSIKQYFCDNKYFLILLITLFIGFLSRLLCLDLLPGGLNQDEASAGYDAYSIMKWGVDRNGNFLPVHLVAWGSGQNALYSYILIPFIGIFGLNEISVRLPMAIIGCLSLVIFYKLLVNQFDKRFAYIGLIFLIINPWHFMKSRWGLESNIFPDLILYSVYFLLDFLKTKRIWKLVLSSIIFGFSSYSYGTSYFFLFFFVIISYIYLICTKKLKWQHSLISLAIIGVICIPIIMFLGINIFDGQTIHMGITIPKLPVDRFRDTTVLFSDNFFKDSWDNFIRGLKMLITQNDGLIFNTIPFIGYTYMFSIPFTIYGLFNNQKDKNEFNWILRIWLIVSLLMMPIVKANTNRLNIIFFPIIVFTFIGLNKFVTLVKNSKYVIFSYYAVSFITFLGLYIGPTNQKISDSFFDGFGDAIKYAETIDPSYKVMVTNRVNMPYIHVLYFTGYDVNDFIKTVDYINPGQPFQRVSSFGKYTFGLDNSLNENTIYIASKDDTFYLNLDPNNYETKQFNNFYVVSKC